MRLNIIESESQIEGRSKRKACRESWKMRADYLKG